jgi:hypothetical protein
MCAGKTGAYLIEVPLRCSTLALLTEFRLGWKDLSGTNTLAYYENSYVTDFKSFITLSPAQFHEVPRRVQHDRHLRLRRFDFEDEKKLFLQQQVLEKSANQQVQMLQNFRQA